MHSECNLLVKSLLHTLLTLCPHVTRARSMMGHKPTAAVPTYVR